MTGKSKNTRKESTFHPAAEVDWASLPSVAYPVEILVRAFLLPDAL